MSSGTKGKCNLYGNASHKPDNKISFKYAIAFNRAKTKTDTGKHHTCLNMEKEDYKKYIEDAIAFANKVDPINHESFVDENNSTFKYIYLTKEFIIIKSDGVVISYFRPKSLKDDRYWNNVKRRHSII